MGTAQAATGIFMNGLTISAMYILVASGFALMLNIMGIFNFAHGAIYALGGYLVYGFGASLGVNNMVALLLAMVACGLLGFGLEKFAWRPFSNNILGVVVISIALIFVIETTLNLLYGGSTMRVDDFIAGNLQIGFFSTSWTRIFTLAVGIVVLVALTLFITKTRPGQRMLAASQDKVGAKLQGVNINRSAAYASAIACAAAALAGGLMGSLLGLNPYMGDAPLTKAIEVVILSGFGSIGGVFVGGIIIGFLDAVLQVYFNAGTSTAISMSVIILILIVRPKGLFGHEMA
jgi:branched-chain amino acid transport system permease protein